MRDIGDWTTRLAKVIEEALTEFRGHVQDDIEMFAVDCSPWNGFLGLALLTGAEVEQDSLLHDPAEMAAWKYFDFGSGLRSWAPTGELGRQMQQEYQAANDAHDAIAERFFRACAEALAADGVQQELRRYSLGKTFRISVCHPDSGQEYYPPT